MKRPGDIVYQRMSAQGMSLEELAKALGLTYRRLEDLLDSELVITPDLADKLSHALGGCPKYWLDIEEKYVRDYNGF